MIKLDELIKKIEEIVGTKIERSFDNLNERLDNLGERLPKNEQVKEDTNIEEKEDNDVIIEL